MRPRLSSHRLSSSSLGAEDLPPIEQVSLEAPESVDLTDGAEDMSAPEEISAPAPSFLTVTSPGHVKRLSSWLAAAEADAAAQMESPAIRNNAERQAAVAPAAAASEPTAAAPVTAVVMADDDDDATAVRVVAAVVRRPVEAAAPSAMTATVPSAATEPVRRPPPIQRADSEFGSGGDSLEKIGASESFASTRFSSASTPSEAGTSFSMPSSMRSSYAVFAEQMTADQRFGELLRTEAEYMTDLRTMLAVYARPAHKLQILSTEEKAAIFGNTEQVHAPHTHPTTRRLVAAHIQPCGSRGSYLPLPAAPTCPYLPLPAPNGSYLPLPARAPLTLEARVSRPSLGQLLVMSEALHDELTRPGEAEVVWADAFLTTAPYFKLYTAYCRNYMSALEMTRRCRQRDGFDKFLSSAHARTESKGLLLEDFLIKPVRHRTVNHGRRRVLSHRTAIVASIATPPPHDLHRVASSAPPISAPRPPARASLSRYQPQSMLSGAAAAQVSSLLRIIH